MFGFGRKKKASASNDQKDRQISGPSSGIKGSLMSLEQRLMFDAAASATASEVASEQVAQEQAEAAVSSDSHADGETAEQAESQNVLDAIATYNPGESRSEVVFVDPTVPNYQDLLSSMNSNVEVIMLDGGQDGIEQMANALSGRTDIDAIHLISHGDAGELQLGTGVLNADSMTTQYADDLAVIQQSLSEQADILVYGCEFAQGEAGQAAVDMLADLTGADVQASNDLTGSISLGGDWELEVSTGTIETSLAVDYDAQMNWAEVLGNETVADTFSDKSYGNNDGTRSWSSNWAEVDRGASDANGGHSKVNSGELRIETQVAGASVSRGVDLSGANSAQLSFDYNNDLDKGGSVEVRISSDGGANYRTLSDGIFSKASHIGSGTASFDISDHMSANTKIQFVVTGTSGGDRLFIDNVQVDYHVADANAAPTDLSLSANTVTEQATTGTVVGTVSGTDPDAGDTKSYSLTDTAGGRFAINASTGEITVADGALLNYESATSHTVTVRVTDSGGQSYNETFTINLTDVTEAPVGADATDAPTEDMANILTTVNFGMRETNRIPNAPSSGLSLLIESEEEGFRLPDGLQKTIYIKPEAPLTADILTPSRNGPSAVSEKLSENVMATRETSQLAHPNENRGSDALRDSMLAQGAAVAEANRKDFLEPGDPIENADESTALKLSSAVGLAGVALQNSLGNNTKVSRLLSRPASASNVHPNTMPQKSADDDRASHQNRSEHPRPVAEGADQAET